MEYAEFMGLVFFGWVMGSGLLYAGMKFLLADAPKDPAFPDEPDEDAMEGRER